MTGSRDEECIQIIFLDQTVHVDVGERLTGIRTPVTEKTRLDVFELQWFLQKRVVLEVERSQAKVQTRMPVSDVVGDFFLGQWLVGDCSSSRPERAQLLVFGRHDECLSMGEAVTVTRRWSAREEVKFATKCELAELEL